APSGSAASPPEPGPRSRAPRPPTHGEAVCVERNAPGVVTSADMPRAFAHPDKARGFSTLRLMGLGSGSLGLAATWALYNTFMPLLLAQFMSSAGVRGTIMALDTVIAVLMLPFVGAWSDRLSGPLGKRIPFLLVGMPLSAVLFATLPLADATLW